MVRKKMAYFLCYLKLIVLRLFKQAKALSAKKAPETNNAKKLEVGRESPAG